MPMFKVSFMVLPEVYRALQLAAAREQVALPVYVRDAVFKASAIDPSVVNDQTGMHGPKFTPTKRDLLMLLQKQRGDSTASPWLTTSQISGSLQQSDQSVYLNLRALLRDGMIERGENVIRSGNPGAPLKTYAISEHGIRCLTDDLARLQRAHKDYQTRSQAAYTAIAPAAPKGNDQAYAPQVHSMLRYIAMAQLGRAIESEADVEGMKASHARLVEAADADVTSGAHTYAQILEKVTAKVQALGGLDAISERFNIG